MGKSPVIYTRISRGTGIAGCFAGEHLSRAPPGSPGEGGGGAGSVSPEPRRIGARRSRCRSGLPRTTTSLGPSPRLGKGTNLKLS